jgi:hypothetical protein
VTAFHSKSTLTRRDGRSRHKEAASDETWQPSVCTCKIRAEKKRNEGGRSKEILIWWQFKV